MADKNITINIDDILSTDKEFSTLNQEIQGLYQERNAAARDRDIEKGKESIQLNTLLKVLDVLNIHMKFETPFPQEDKK